MTAVQILAWPLKRVILATLADAAAGVAVPPGAEPLISSVSRPVQVAHFLPPEPDRICVYGMPLRGGLREVTAESTGIGAESPSVEVRVRVHEPGEDVVGVDTVLGEILDAVATAILHEPLVALGRVWVAAYAQNPPDYDPPPEPAVTMTAGLVFRAEVVGHG